MKQIYLVPGYGVTKNIFKDHNYYCYILQVINNIFSDVSSQKISKPIIIFAGGKTDLFKPYKRSEAGEMKKLFNSLVKQKYIKDIAKDWRVLTESRSLSTYENFTFIKEKIEKLSIRKYKINIFCEYLHTNRLKYYAREYFKNKHKVVPIDFDASPNRYISCKLAKYIEERGLYLDKAVVTGKISSKEHHQLYKNRLVLLRNQGKLQNTDDVIKYWDKVINEFKTKN